MRPPCDLGLTDGHFDIPATKLCIMLKFSGNLEATCICISSMIMTQLSIFSVSEKGKNLQSGGWHACIPSITQPAAPYPSIAQPFEYGSATLSQAQQPYDSRYFTLFLSSYIGQKITLCTITPRNHLRDGGSLDLCVHIFFIDFPQWVPWTYLY